MTYEVFHCSTQDTQSTTTVASEAKSIPDTVGADSTEVTSDDQGQAASQTAPPSVDSSGDAATAINKSSPHSNTDSETAS